MSLIETDAPLAERSWPGIHDAVAQHLTAHVAPATAILDCGAGTGAWANRLRSLGYEHVHGVDRDAEGYRGAAPFITADLNGPFADALHDAFGAGRYGLITAIEVIEHLENPSHFLRQCRALLDDSGTLLATSPNPICAPARLTLFADGRLRHFDPLGDPTHITPIFPFLLERLARANGFRLDAVIPVPHADAYLCSSAWKRAVTRRLARMLGGHVHGDCNLFVLKPQA